MVDQIQDGGSAAILGEYYENHLSPVREKISEHFLDATGLGEKIGGLQEALSERLADLGLQLEKADGTAQQLELEQEIERLQEALADFQAALDEAVVSNDEIDLGILRASTDFDVGRYAEIADQVGAMISELRQDVIDSYAQFGTCALPGEVAVSHSASPPVDEATVNSLCGDITSDGGGELAGASQDVGANSTVDFANLDGASPQEMVNLLSSDPDAFYAEMQDLDPEDRMVMMMTVQQQLQEMNQLFNMISQFSQAIHDTHKAMIQNLRV